MTEPVFVGDRGGVNSCPADCNMADDEVPEETLEWMLPEGRWRGCALFFEFITKGISLVLLCGSLVSFWNCTCLSLGELSRELVREDRRFAAATKGDVPVSGITVVGGVVIPSFIPEIEAGLIVDE